MVKVKIGNIFSSKAQTLVNTVNCVGVMGKGIALEFKKRFPDMFDDYVKRCKSHEVKLGKPYLFKRLIPPWILNFPTKDHWRSVSRLNDIEEGLNYLTHHYHEWGITSIAVPPLGCGQGQLEWRVVGPILYRAFKEFKIPVELYAPFETPLEELNPVFLDKAQQEKVIVRANDAHVPYRIEPGWFAIVEILYKIEEEPYHWTVGRTTFQKIAYFATESGIPTGLHYQRGSFGPYAPDLKRCITSLVNNGLIREEQLGRMFAVRVGDAFFDSRLAYKDKIDEWSTIIDNVSDLFMRMNTQQAEIAATVHYAAKELNADSSRQTSENDIFQRVMDWKQRRRPPLDPKEVVLAVRSLNMLGWIHASFSNNLPINEEEFFSL